MQQTFAPVDISRITCQRLGTVNNKVQIAQVVDLLNRTSPTCNSTVEELTEYTTRNYWSAYIARDDRTAEVVGVLFYSTYQHGRKIEIVAVDVDYRRHGIAKSLVKCLVDLVARLDLIREITSIVPERNVLAQKLLKSSKFACLETIKADGEDDQYLFGLKKAESECCEVMAEKMLAEAGLF